MEKRVVIFTGLVKVDKNLVGTAVIYQKIAEIFYKQGYNVDLVGPDKTNHNDSFFRHFSYEEKNNQKLIKAAKVVIFGAYPPVKPLIYAYQKNKIIMTYLWSIAPIGSLEFKDFNNIKDQAQLHRFITASYNLSLLLSDKIFCRDAGIKKLILGSLLSLGRLNLENYLIDKKLHHLITEAPFGISSDKPVARNNLYRGKIKGIGESDFILLWNGGIWNWNDGETLIRAMSILKNKKIKLIFQGFKHPDNNQKLSVQARKCLNLAVKLGLKDKTVFFTSAWVPYQDRGSFLLESDLGVVSSPDILEANLFFKTRIYDYFWADLPIIINDCEAFASLVQENKLGLIAKTGDEADWAKKIYSLYRDTKLRQEIKANIKKYKQKINWAESLRPIEEFAKKPKRSIDATGDNKFIKENIKNNLKVCNF